MSDPIRNRIKAHRRVRAGDLLVHELNFRLHLELQRDAMQAIYQQVELTRSAGERMAARFVKITLALSLNCWHPPTLVRPKVPRRITA